MRHLAIDYGTRRFGIALSDEGGKLATPLAVLQVRSPEAALDQIVRLIEEHQPRVLVVGVPLNMDGSIGPMAGAARHWARQLAQRTGRRLVLVDERLSTFEAEQSIRSRKQAGDRITREGRKSRLDALAAAQMLQSYLDGTTVALEI